MMDPLIIDFEIETIKIGHNRINHWIDNIIGFDKWCMDNYKKYHEKKPIITKQQ